MSISADVGRDEAVLEVEVVALEWFVLVFGSVIEGIDLALDAGADGMGASKDEFGEAAL